MGCTWVALEEEKLPGLSADQEEASGVSARGERLEGRDATAGEGAIDIRHNSRPTNASNGPGSQVNSSNVFFTHFLDYLTFVKLSF